MDILFIYLSAATIFITAIIHSLLGERRLISPILALGEGPLQHLMVRQLIRFAWHFTSVLMFLSAVVLLIVANMPSSSARYIIAVIGLTYLAVGLFDGVVSRGKHIGWWFLTAAGGLALMAFV